MKSLVPVWGREPRWREENITAAIDSFQREHGALPAAVWFGVESVTDFARSLNGPRTYLTGVPDQDAKVEIPTLSVQHGAVKIPIKVDLDLYATGVWLGSETLG